MEDAIINMPFECVEKVTEECRGVNILDRDFSGDDEIYVVDVVEIKGVDIDFLIK